jgi:hypothetical protein
LRGRGAFVYPIASQYTNSPQPIRSPGAVQGFGVLIAVDELEDALVVRQVSEVGS